MVTPVRRRRSRVATDTGSHSSEAVSIWYGLGFPLVTFCCWLGGLLLLHPWAGFFVGLGISFVVGSRLIAATRR
jgi:hypothetical protein